MKTTVIVAAFLAFGASSAYAKTTTSYDNDGRTYARSFFGGHYSTRHHRRHRYVVSHKRHHVRSHYVRHHRGGGGGSVSLAGVVAPLAEKARQIVSTCGSTIVSAVAGRSRHSNHPLGRAVDLHGNPSCIYSLLHNWPGGYSTDYATAPYIQHVHVSYNPKFEWGARFVHRGYGRTRYAKRKHYRVQYAHLSRH